MYRAFTTFVLIVATVLVAFPAVTVTAHDQAASDAAVPTNLAPPTDSVLLFSFAARGFQIYACEAKPDDGTAYEWTFKAPEAELLNARGEVVGQHFAGPTWQGHDGSAVVANVEERADAPESGAIPWLLLEATDHTGSGVFATITYIQRLDTVGGVAPGDGCDAAHAGEEVREPYEATYAFYYPAAPGALDAATPAD
jgi:hypothetical protein